MQNVGWGCAETLPKKNSINARINFLAGLQRFGWLPIKNNMAEAWK